MIAVQGGAHDATRITTALSARIQAFMRNALFIRTPQDPQRSRCSGFHPGQNTGRAVKPRNTTAEVTDALTQCRCHIRR